MEGSCAFPEKKFEECMKRNPLIRYVFMAVGFLGLGGWGAVPPFPRAVSHTTSARPSSSHPPHQVADSGNLPLAFRRNPLQTHPQLHLLSVATHSILFLH